MDIKIHLFILTILPIIAALTCKTEKNFCIVMIIFYYCLLGSVAMILT